MKINNAIYNELGEHWWDASHPVFATIRYFVQPVRFAYFSRIVRERSSAAHGMTVLDLGCGGGFLSEDFARAGFTVTGVDPSEKSITTARTHAKEQGLEIAYAAGKGESLRFPDQSFDIVACCDVLEHVSDLERVMGEISRVLKIGGIFFYDTVNRTAMSWLSVIKAAQDWKFSAFEAPNTHVWGKFITPEELEALMVKDGIRPAEHRGITPGINPLACLVAMRQHAKGAISCIEFGERMKFQESDNLSCSYMGYGIKG